MSLDVNNQGRDIQEGSRGRINPGPSADLGGGALPCRGSKQTPQMSQKDPWLSLAPATTPPPTKAPTAGEGVRGGPSEGLRTGSAQYGEESQYLACDSAASSGPHVPPSTVSGGCAGLPRRPARESDGAARRSLQTRATRMPPQVT